MNNDSYIAQMIKLVPELVAEHLKSTMPRLKRTKATTESEVRLLNEFMNGMMQIGEEFERKVFEASEKFQLQVKERVKDEKLGQIYQLIINNLLKFTDGVQHTLFNFKGYGEVIQSYLTDYESIINSVESNIGLNVETLDLRIKENDKRLFDQTEYYRDHRTSIISAEDNNEKATMQELEEARKLVAEDSLAMAKHNVELLTSKLRDVVKYEAAMKNTVKDISTKVINDLVGINSNETPRQIKELDSNLEKFMYHSESVYREANLVFSDFVDFNKYNRIFCEFETLKKLNGLLENKYNRYVHKKIMEFGSKLKARERLFIEVFLESLYMDSTPIDERTVRKMNALLNNLNARSYLVFNLILKKGQLLSERPFDVIILDCCRFHNFEVLVKQLLDFDEQRKKLDLETVYHLMKFSINLFDESYTNLLRLYRFSVIFNSLDFWVDLLSFFKGYLKPKQAEDGEIITLDEEIDNEKAQKRFQFISLKFKTGSHKHVHSPAELAFENLLYLAMHCGLDFERLKDIIAKVGPRVDLPFKRIKKTIKKKKPMFLASLESIESIRKANRYRNENYADYSKKQRLYLILKLSLPYISYKTELVSIILLNRYFATRSLKLYNALLYRGHVTDRQERIFLYNKNINSQVLKQDLHEDFQPAEIDPLINLDMKRTAYDDGLDDQLKMEAVLRNVCHSSGANFSYYQGLNYITRYFFLMYKGDVVGTYNIVSSLMADRFSCYFDAKFKNLRKLFFMLKAVIKMHLPVLYRYLMDIHKLDIEIVFTAWCLTLFTPLIQYTHESHLLDEIIDIFISKGWAGLFRVVLVIMDRYQPKIYGAQYDQILVLFSGLLKQGFAEFFDVIETDNQEPVESFSFKVAVRKYRSVNKRLLNTLEDEYVDALQELDKTIEGLKQANHKK